MATLLLDSYAGDWLDLLLRWLHVIAGIAWVGSSFYFIALDYHLDPPKDEHDAEAGVAGESWEVHGGGFYRVQKYRVAPQRLPERLHWFKWEAYTTWLSGFALLVVLYYLDADVHLVDPGVADISTAAAIAVSAGALVIAWIVYDVLCRLLGGRELLLGALLVLFVTAAAYGLWQVLAPRAVYIEVGAMLGTIMAANVFFVIIPAHRELVRAKEAGRDPDPAWNARGKQRSVHNNYLTLPVVVAMLANHAPIAYGSDEGWLVLVALMLLGAWVRHFFNLRHRGRTVWAIPATAAVGVALVAVWIAPRDGDDVSVEPPPSPAVLEQGRALFLTAGCGSCHTLADAGSTGTVGPSLDASSPSHTLVVDRVTNGRGAMPPFRGQLTGTEIEVLAAYVSAASLD
jgi:uncharacterized membrane protein